MSETRAYTGDALKQRREELGYTLSAVYRKIHISERCLEALESGTFDALPGPAYAVGFLKTYCEFLNLDAAIFVEDYRAATARPTGFLAMARTSGSDGIPPRWHDALTWAAICAFLALGWLAYTLVVRPEPNGPNDRVRAGTIEVVEEDPFALPE